MTRHDRSALFLLLLIAIAASVIVNPTDDFPFIDDWAYAWSVEHLLDTGGMRVLDWSAHYPLAQIGWGALFSLPFGFSFFSLRVSTLVLSWIATAALYLTIRRLSVSVSYGVLAALVFYFNPLVFVLSHSFMTDLPFLAFLNLSLLFYVIWCQTGRGLALGLGGVFATLAFLVRQVGALLPLIPVIHFVLLRASSRRIAPLGRGQTALMAFPFVAIAATLWWISNVHGLTSVAARKARAIDYLFSLSSWVSGEAWWVYLGGAVHALVYGGFLLAPVALVIARWKLTKSLVVSTVIIAILAGLEAFHSGAIPAPLEEGQTLSLEELGASRPLITGDGAMRSRPEWLVWLLQGVSLLSAAVVIGTFFEKLRLMIKKADVSVTPVVLNIVLQFGAIMALWLYYDRYYLPLLPALITLMIHRVRPSRFVAWGLTTVVILSAAVSISGTIDNVRFRKAVGDSYQALIVGGVPPRDIDGGYALNGWWLYAHPENLPPGARPERNVPFVTSSRMALPYRISNTPRPNYEVTRQVGWNSLWAASNRVYVLKRVNQR